MAKITGLPNTCSAFYLSEVSEMDDIKKLIADHMAKDHERAVQQGAKPPFAGIKHTCAYFSSVVRPAVIKKLEEAGFIKVSGYHSHRHSRAVSFMMLRPTSKGEWDSGKAAFPKKKRK